MFGPHLEQKRAWDSLELEFHAVVKHHVVLGIKPKSSGRAPRAPKFEPSLHFLILARSAILLSEGCSLSCSVVTEWMHKARAFFFLRTVEGTPEESNVIG